jgi:hypothetical protein
LNYFSEKKSLFFFFCFNQQHSRRIVAADRGTVKALKKVFPNKTLKFFKQQQNIENFGEITP